MVLGETTLAKPGCCSLLMTYLLPSIVPVLTTFLQISKKAFDTVSLLLVLLKLWKININAKILKWIECFLTNRNQYVRASDCDSPMKAYLKLCTLTTCRKITRINLFHKIYYTNFDIRTDMVSPPTYISPHFDHGLKVAAPSCQTNLLFNSFCRRQHQTRTASSPVLPATLILFHLKRP